MAVVRTSTCTQCGKSVSTLEVNKRTESHMVLSREGVQFTISPNGKQDVNVVTYDCPQCHKTIASDEKSARHFLLFG